MLSAYFHQSMNFDEYNNVADRIAYVFVVVEQL